MNRSSMKLLVNVTSLYGQMTGIGHYTANLLRGLLDCPSVEDIQGIGLTGIWSKERITRRLQIEEKEAATSPQGSTSAFLYLARRLLTRIPNMIQLVQQIQGWQMRLLGPGENYLYWEPSYVLLPHRGPSVVTVHDLSHLRHPDFHPKERVRWLNRHLSASLSRADHIIVVSRFTCRELLAYFDLPQNRISVVPPGVGPEFRPFTPSQVETVLNRHGLEWKRYLLSVGTLEPRKNLLGLIRSFQSLPAWMRRRHPLVLVGARGWLTDEIERLAARLESFGELRWLGYVPRQDLPCLYAGALGFGYVSFYEGFGMPVLEAMACGTPVLTSSRGALLETAGNAALNADPDNLEEMAIGLALLIEDERERRRLTGLGLKRAREFTWEGSVAKIRCCFESTMKTFPPSK